MIPPIAKFSIALNTILTIIVAIDVKRDLDRFKTK
jgi:hypothetical protein